MKFNELVEPWFATDYEQKITGLSIDSRLTQSGDLFLCLQGHAVHGQSFIDSALAAGAVCALIHTDIPDQHGLARQAQKNVIYFYNLHGHLADLVSIFYKTQELPIKMVGVTGTNGKTSVAHFIAQIGDLIDCKTAVLGTVGNGFLNNLEDSVNTTADAIFLAKQIESLSKQDARCCAIEVSSHGLVQQRVNALRFDLSILTNITRDHIDYHLTMNNYVSAKKRLFNSKLTKVALFNLDDAYGADFFNEFELPKYSYSIQRRDADYFLTDIVRTDYIFAAQLVTPVGSFPVRIKTLARFNLSNILAAVAAQHILGASLTDIVPRLSLLKPVCGRTNFINKPNKPCFVVDYAHTPDSLLQVLRSLREHAKGKLWCVFGCGGDRDFGKRPLMAKIAEENADHLLITSDNPRSESLSLIFSHMRAGLSDPAAVIFEADRKQAIKKAMALAGVDDLVLVAGKGHESYQEIKGAKINHNDYQFIMNTL